MYIRQCRVCARAFVSSSIGCKKPSSLIRATLKMLIWSMKLCGHWFLNVHSSVEATDKKLEKRTEEIDVNAGGISNLPITTYEWINCLTIYQINEKESFYSATEERRLTRVPQHFVDYQQLNFSHSIPPVCLRQMHLNPYHRGKYHGVEMNM